MATFGFQAQDPQPLRAANALRSTRSGLVEGTMSQTAASSHRSDGEAASNTIEERLRLIIDTLPTMVWTLRPEGTVDYVNQRWLDYTGLTFEQEIEGPPGVVQPEDLPRVMKKWLADMTDGEPSYDEMRLRRADGEYRWFLVRTAPLRDAQGNVVK